jgi:DNA modification methylase
MRVWKEYSRTHVYSYKYHVEISKQLEDLGGISKEFMTLPPASVSPTVWDDVVRMRTLNTSQSKRGVNLHVCPLQLGIIERGIMQYSNKGDVVYDPFNGIGSTTMMAVKMGRYGLGSELNEDYYRDSIGYCEDAEREVDSPTLFDFLENEGEVKQA